MTFNELFEALFFGPPIQQGPGLPDPPTQRKPAQIAVPKPLSGRLVNADTNTYEWDLSRARVNHGASHELSEQEMAALQNANLKNGPWNAVLKLARLQGKTIAEGAKAAGCSTSYAGKAYSVFGRFER